MSAVSSPAAVRPVAAGATGPPLLCVPRSALYPFRHRLGLLSEADCASDSAPYGTQLPMLGGTAERRAGRSPIGVLSDAVVRAHALPEHCLDGTIPSASTSEGRLRGRCQ
jgi:hypothetical protein